jgi:hypothetical protein
MPHEPHCDQSHSPRQRCNDALAPGAEALNNLVPPPSAPQAPSPLPQAPESNDAPTPGPSPLLREAVIAGAMPAPSPYATRAWEDTVRSLESSADAGADSHNAYRDLESAAPPRESALPVVAAASLLALALCLVLGRLRKRS